MKPLQSWVESANAADCDFPIENLPFGVFRHGESAPRIGVAIGDGILDLCRAAELGRLPEPASFACKESTLNKLMALARPAYLALRQQLVQLLSIENAEAPRECLCAMSECEMFLPVEIGDYTDFYASVFHATNVGSMFRPDNPLLPNYKYVPIGYHGRTSSIVVGGTSVARPSGQLQQGTDAPVVGPCRQLDYECEIGIFIGRGNPLGRTIPIDEAGQRIFGVCLLNDWSARDIQRWEYQPLGPFLAKSFSTSISPWVVTIDALEPFRTKRFERAEGDPQPLPYLDCESDRERGGIAINVEVWLQSEKMRQSNLAPIRLSRAGFEQMYWTAAQMVAHHSSNGCNLRTGDLLGSGTVSGPDRDSWGSLLEVAWRGEQPVSLPSGESREFLEDGDEVILRGYCEREGLRRIGLGECRGKIVGK